MVVPRAVDGRDVVGAHATRGPSECVAITPQAPGPIRGHLEERGDRVRVRRRERNDCVAQTDS